MAGLFYSLGRRLGYVTIPAIQKSKAAWKSLAGDGVNAIRAETEFGRAMATELRLKTGVNQDPATLDPLREILGRLGACVRNKARTFSIQVLLDRAPIAMALPGGFIFVSTGLLDFCRNDTNELAFLIGHEMGHVVRGHALERTLTRIGAEGLSAILSRGLLNPVLRETGLAWLQGSHAGEAEMDADEFGIRVAWGAGYDAQASLTLFERLARMRDAGQLRTSGYFSSHPPESERAAKAALVLEELGRAAQQRNATRPPSRD